MRGGLPCGGLSSSLLFLTLAPAIAAYAKLSFIKLLADRTPLADLPGWIFTYGKLGLVEVCGRAATDAATIAQACAAMAGGSPVLRLQDVALSPDMIVLALPDIAGLDHPMLGLIAAVALAVALATANGPLSAIVRALGLHSGASGADTLPRTSRLASYALAAVVVAAATLGAVARPASILDIATWAFVLAAAGLFPALFAALWWKRANAYGAAAAMLAGFAVALIYLVGTRYFAVPFFEATSALSSAGPAGQEVFAELKDAWVAAEPGATKDAAWAALHAQARDGADWWGINGLAVAVLALPVGFTCARPSVAGDAAAAQCGNGPVSPRVLALAAMIYDLVVAGGGINGAGIAADAAGRGLSVLLVEKGDLGGATSSASSKLIHGGLRYLEHFEFRLVREALQEREVLLANAGHIIWPQRFVLPQVPGARPALMLRAGLFLYDHLGQRQRIPASQSLDLRRDHAGHALRRELTHGFAYWDCRVDDARLVVLNARAAAQRGAAIANTHSAYLRSRGRRRLACSDQGRRRHARGAGHGRSSTPPGHGCATSTTTSGLSRRRRICASSKAATSWCRASPAPTTPTFARAPTAASCSRIPYEERFTLIGTTEIGYSGDPAAASISGDEEEYLLALARQFFCQPAGARGHRVELCRRAPALR